MPSGNGSARWWWSAPATRAWPPPATWPGPASTSWCSRPATGSAGARSPTSPRPGSPSTGAGSGSAPPRTTWPRWPPSWGCARSRPTPPGQGVELRDGRRELYVGLIPTSDAARRGRGRRRHARPRPGRLRGPARRPVGGARRRRAGRPDPGLLARRPPRVGLGPRHPRGGGRRPSSAPGSGELSLLFALFYLHAGGGLANLARTTGGAQERRFAGGSQQLAHGHGRRAGGPGRPRAPRSSRVAHGPDGVVTLGARLVDPGCRPGRPRRAAPRAAACGPGAPSSPWRRHCAAASPSPRRSRDAATSSASACRWAR